VCKDERWEENRNGGKKMVNIKKIRRKEK